MWFFYRIVIQVYFFGIRVAATFRKDARAWRDGRIAWKQKLLEKQKEINPDHRKSIWIHVSSLGEFEQVRSLIDKLKFEFPKQLIFVSFFSPSGYNYRKNYPHADLVCYFPSDNRADVHEFINMINPSFVIFVKYDFWFNTLKFLKQKNIPYYFISMHLSLKSYLRKSIFKTYLMELKNAKKLFLQSKETFNFLLEHGFKNIKVCGDTRLDRVLEIREKSTEVRYIEEFKGRSKLLILGSSWQKEVKLLFEIYQSSSFNDWKIMIAPHLPNEEHINEIEMFFPHDCSRYSQIDFSKKILIIDQIGFLAEVYKYGDLAFIGGGYGKGIHNTLEAIAQSCPVCFGPKYQKFPEAVQFIQLGVGFEIRHADDLLQIITKFERKDFKLECDTKIQKWVQDHKGASQKIFEFIKLEENLI